MLACQATLRGARRPRLVIILMIIGLCALAGPTLAQTEKVIFEERFGEQLGDGWTWLNEHAASKRFENGKFVMLPTGGSWWRDSKNSRNDLVRAAPTAESGDMAVEVFVENTPSLPYEHAGLVWFSDEDHYIALNKEYIGGKTIILFVVEQDGKPLPPFGEVPYEPVGVWLRLRASGRTVTGQFRQTEQDPWQTIGAREFPGPGPQRVGLHSGYGSRPNAPPRPASFSQFRIVRIEQK